MIDKENQISEHLHLSHEKKLAKVKSLLFSFKDKSHFLNQLYLKFKDKWDISESMLDYLYKILSDLINDQTKKLMLSDEENILKKLKADVQ